MHQSFPVPTIHRMLALAAFLAANEHHELGLRIAEDTINVSTNTFNLLRRDLRAFVFSREPLANNGDVLSLLRALETKGRMSMPKLNSATMGLLFNGSNDWIVQDGGEWLRAFLLDVVISAVADVAQIVNDRENTLVLPFELEHQRKVLHDAIEMANIPEAWIAIDLIKDRMPYSPVDTHHLVFVEMIDPTKFVGSANEYHDAADCVDNFIQLAKRNGLEMAGKQIQTELRRAAREGSWAPS